MEDTPLPARPRKPTLPPAGGSSARLEARVMVLEREEQHQGQKIDKIDRATVDLDQKFDAMRTDITELTGLVNQLVEGRKFWVKLAGALLLTACVAMFGILLKISYIVQSGKLPGP